MPTFPVIPMGPARTAGDDVYHTYNLASGQDFEVGSLALLDNGLVQEAGNDPALILGVFLASSKGYEWMGDATFGPAAAQIPVASARQIFRGTLVGTYAASDIDKLYGVLKIPTNHATLSADAGTWVVDKGETSATRVRIIGVDDGVVANDVNVPCEFIIIPTYRQVP